MKDHIGLILLLLVFSDIRAFFLLYRFQIIKRFEIDNAAGIFYWFTRGLWS